MFISHRSGARGSNNFSINIDGILTEMWLKLNINFEQKFILLHLKSAKIVLY